MVEGSPPLSLALGRERGPRHHAGRRSLSAATVVRGAAPLPAPRRFFEGKPPTKPACHPPLLCYATTMTSKLYYGDNLEVLRDAIGDASVDLVYLDPPFNSNARSTPFPTIPSP